MSKKTLKHDRSFFSFFGAPIKTIPETATFRDTIIPLLIFPF